LIGENHNHTQKNNINILINIICINKNGDEQVFNFEDVDILDVFNSFKRFNISLEANKNKFS
jgi:hypothetical protein